MKKAFRVAIAMLFVLVFAVVGLSSAMNASAEYVVPEFNAEDNIALDSKGATATASSYYENESKRHPENAIDGTGLIDNDDDYWQAGNKDSNWIKISWEEAKTFNTVVVRWKNGSRTNVDKLAFDNANGKEVTFDAAADYVQNSGIGAQGTADKVNTDVINFNGSVTTNGVYVYISGEFAGGCGNVPGEVLAVEVYNLDTVEETIIGDGNIEAETAVIDGVKSVFVATNVAEADLSANACIKASYTITKADGTFAEGEVFIRNAYSSIALGDEVISVEGEYVTGVLFNNVDEDATVEVKFTVAYN